MRGQEKVATISSLVKTHSTRIRILFRLPTDVWFAVLLIGLTGCGEVKSPSEDAPRGSLHSIAFSKAGATTTGEHDQPQGRFVRISADQTGIDFLPQWTPPDDERFQAQITNAMAGGGVSIGDYDSDGLADVYLTRPFGGNRLYRNLGRFRFEDVTTQAGLVTGQDSAKGKTNPFWGAGATFVDIDNDGDLDLYACGYESANRLYVNQGDSTFVEMAATYGLDYQGASVMMAFADYDRDGDLDGYLLTNARVMPDALSAKQQEFFKACAAGQVPMREGKFVVPERLREFCDVLPRPRDHQVTRIQAGQADLLFRNDSLPGTPKFTDVSSKSNVGGYHLGLSAIWWDADGDDWPDLYVANDFWGPDKLYHNNHNGTFTDISKTALPHTPWYSMGTDVADINNDGRLDLMASDMSSSGHYKSKVNMGDMDRQGWFLEYPTPRQYMRNALYINSGTERFLEAAFLAGVDSTDWTWSIKFADFDQDGRVDLFVSNGMTRNWWNSDLRKKNSSSFSESFERVWRKQPPMRVANIAYKNQGDLKMESIGPSWGLADETVTFGAALGDLDGDGDLDLVTNNFEEPAGVYQNQVAGGHSLLLRLEGAVSNRYGIGTTVRITTQAGEQVRYLTLARGFMSSDEPILHFGLGEAQDIERLTVNWPSGIVQTFGDLAADRLYTITEPEEGETDAAQSNSAAGDSPAMMFVPAAALAHVLHTETSYDDFARQPLLPQKLSQLGPGLACGDVDNDGDDDLYLSGAAGQLGVLYLQQEDGQFQPHQLTANAPARAASEEMAPLWFDADGDSDLDLYVVSGGVECEAGTDELRDRLYLNDGQGRFTEAPAGALPDLTASGSVVAAADFDRDGDLDLFVGGRSIPGRYPETPASQLLVNEGGRFQDLSDELAPGLARTGLVTSAIWSDCDNDGWIDLLVAHEWGPVKLWRNHEGRLVDGTAAAGLTQWTGWFNGIAARDLDADGDIDYVVTNFGLNTKYHATVESPAVLYYGDFKDHGQMNLVEAQVEHDALYPVRGKSCSTAAMPFLADRYSTFHEFALADLEDIYTPECLDDALKLTANTLESGVLLNDGEGQFVFHPLPRIAQIAPGFGLVLTEVDGDGSADLVIAQNFHSPQRETGHMDGGVSQLLLGRGDGSFSPVAPHQSGLVVPGDAKGLATTDLNADGWPDFIVGVNNDQLAAFENRGSSKNRITSVALRGPPGNPTAIGSRVTLKLNDGTTQTAEVHAGGGYLSQSTARLAFGLGESARIVDVEVRWPDVTVTTHQPKEEDARLIVLEAATP